MPAKDKRHHAWPYPRDAARVRDAAQRDPTTRCWRCGLTLAQHPHTKTGKPARWTAGHVIDSQRGGPLAPEASTCNASAGATYGNMKREPRSEDW